MCCTNCSGSHLVVACPDKHAQARCICLRSIVLDPKAHAWQWSMAGTALSYSLAQVGNAGLLENEQRSHFALWSLLKSPLFIGADMRKLSKSALKILTAGEVIAVNQDPLGVAGDLIWKEGPMEVHMAMDPQHMQTCKPLPLNVLRTPNSYREDFSTALLRAC